MTNSGGAAGARRVCICDSEVSYGEHLMEYLRQEGRLPGDIYLYTGRETFLERETPETTGLLVIAQSQYTEEIGKAGFKDILLLNDPRDVHDPGGGNFRGCPPRQTDETDRNLFAAHTVSSDNLRAVHGAAALGRFSCALPEFRGLLRI